MKNTNMELLIRQARKRDPDAFTELIELQMQSMYKVARSILHSDEDAADAIQETILTCWEKLWTLKQDRYFKAWLTKILIHNCYSILQKNRSVLYTDELPDVPAPPDEYLTEWEEALSLLDEPYRPVVALYYAQGFRTKEIAQILDVPDGTIRTRLARARKQLEKYYKE